MHRKYETLVFSFTSACCHFERPERKAQSWHNFALLRTHARGSARQARYRRRRHAIAARCRRAPPQLSRHQGRGPRSRHGSRACGYFDLATLCQQSSSHEFQGENLRDQHQSTSVNILVLSAVEICINIIGMLRKNFRKFVETDFLFSPSDP